ncbi:vimentin-type intermediate filament-associated coiled-coil protein isoform X1 [Panthera leo]|uniref:vimentin-type intermediate filament-associated coiled-coil protein isoform X1 n=1 Tax=Panthera leo TaxID=9689 RepID=UPI001C6A36C6|nr:vimentin-type intermediate filament-associated coiled-coil protein isoform X1 [Panthera leo]
MTGFGAEEDGSTPAVLKSPSSFEEALRMERDETSAQRGREVWSPSGKGFGPGWIHSFIFTEHLCASEIAALQEQLLTSEATVHSLQAALRQRNELIGQLQPRAELLQDICRWRPPVAGLLAALAEAERLGPLPTGDPSHPPPSGPGPGLANSTGDEEDRNHLQPAVFGTTV